MVPLPLRTEVALDYPALGLEAGDVEAVISVVAPPIPATTRAPLRLVAVLDKSGSMRGDKLGLLTQTMLFMLRNLSERDALGLVAYDTEVSVLAPLTHCTASGRRRLEAALNRLRAGTQTNLSGGLLEGLDLHRGCRSTGASAASTPMQRAKLGNTYRRLSEEEASEKQNTHFGISAPPDGAQRVHAWTMELRLENEEDIGTVQKVVYRLHETFREPVVEVTEAPFKLTRFGWGTFVVRAEVHLHSGRVINLEHELSFGQPEKFRTVLLNLRDPSPSSCPLLGACADPVAETDGSVVRSTFLFTDGLANVGITQVDQLCRAAENKLGELCENCCTLSTFGFGADHNADLLQNLANIGAGVYSYVESEDQIGQAFGEALGGLLTTTHQNVKLSLELAPAVVVQKTCTDYAVEGPSASSGGANVLSIAIGDLFAEERRDILIALTLPAAVHEGPGAVGQLQATGFSLLSCHTENTTVEQICVERTDGATAARSPGDCHEQVMRQRNRYIATEALQAARELAARGDLPEAQRRVAAAAEAIGSSPLVERGDAFCLGLFTDLKDCERDLRREDTYIACGSKKMAAMKMAHGKQRACFGQEFSVAYTNVSMKTMNASFKAKVQK
jgi:hypothetical protein